MSDLQKLMQELVDSVDMDSLRRAYNIKYHRHNEGEFIGFSIEGILYLHDCSFDYAEYDVIPWEAYEELKEHVEEILIEARRIEDERQNLVDRYNELTKTIAHRLREARKDVISYTLAVETLKRHQSRSPLSKDWGSLIHQKRQRIERAEKVIAGLSAALEFCNHEGVMGIKQPIEDRIAHLETIRDDCNLMP